MFRAKLRRGGHSGGMLVLEDGVLADEPRGGFSAGDVIESAVNLAERYPEKFELLDVRPVSTDDGLSRLTVAQLKELAATEGVELDGTERKDELVTILRMARETA